MTRSVDRERVHKGEYVTLWMNRCSIILQLSMDGVVCIVDFLLCFIQASWKDGIRFVSTTTATTALKMFASLLPSFSEHRRYIAIVSRHPYRCDGYSHLSISLHLPVILVCLLQARSLTQCECFTNRKMALDCQIVLSLGSVMSRRSNLPERRVFYCLLIREAMRVIYHNDLLQEYVTSYLLPSRNTWPYQNQVLFLERQPTCQKHE